MSKIKLHTHDHQTASTYLSLSLPSSLLQIRNIQKSNATPQCPKWVWVYCILMSLGVWSLQLNSQERGTTLDNLRIEKHPLGPERPRVQPWRRLGLLWPAGWTHRPRSRSPPGCAGYIWHTNHKPSQSCSYILPQPSVNLNLPLRLSETYRDIMQ